MGEYLGGTRGQGAHQPPFEKCPACLLHSRGSCIIDMGMCHIPLFRYISKTPDLMRMLWNGVQDFVQVHQKVLSTVTHACGLPCTVAFAQHKTSGLPQACFGNHFAVAVQSTPCPCSVHAVAAFANKHRQDQKSYAASKVGSPLYKALPPGVTTRALCPQKQPGQYILSSCCLSPECFSRLGTAASQAA